MDGEHLTNDWPESINLNAPHRGVSGIYQITNTSNGKFYIGSSQDIRERWRLHFWTLRDGSSHCRYLQSAWTKYGASSFVFEVLELCPKTSLLEREQFYIDSLAPAYNMCLTAGIRNGPLREKTKQKMRKPKSHQAVERMREGVKRSYELNPKLRELRRETFIKVRQDNPDLLRGDNNHMRRTYRTHPGWLKFQTPEVEAKRVATRARKMAEGYTWRTPKPVEQLSLDGVVIKRWPSRVVAAAALGCADVSISHACVGINSTCHGFKWRYVNDCAA